MGSAFVYAWLMTTRIGGREWSTYYDAVAGKPARETLILVLDAFEREDARAVAGVNRVDGGSSGDERERRIERVAIDLGCGEGRDTREILGRGGATRWRVLCCDAFGEGVERTLASIAPGDRGRVEARVAAIEELALDERVMTASSSAATVSSSTVRVTGREFDLVNASFVLPFVEPARFEASWSWIRGVIAPGGRFAGQFFGPRDSWATIEGRSHHTRERVEEMLRGFDVEMLQEDEKDGHDAEGNAKHWHLFHVVARRDVKIG
jgi:tellurite methyltransferase